MGKKRIVKKVTAERAEAKAGILPSGRLPKKKLTSGTFYIQSTYNNTIISLTDEKGGVMLSSSAGSLGFSGARKGTPYAATKVAEFIGERAKMIGLQNAAIIVRGIGAGRESAIRSLASRGFILRSIKDATPIPHNGPKPPKPRRV